MYYCLWVILFPNITSFLFSNDKHTIEVITLGNVEELSEEDLNNPLLQGLEVGTIAPDFSMPNVCSDEDEIFTLSEQIAEQRGVMLFFFRGAW